MTKGLRVFTMAKNKKRTKKYRPRHVAVPWWHRDDERAADTKREFALLLHEGAKALERGDATEEQVNTMGALFRVARVLTSKMADEEALHRQMAFAEGGATMWLRAKEGIVPMHEDFTEHMLKGIAVADQIVSMCSLYELHRAICRTRADRTGFVLMEGPDAPTE